MLFFKKKDKARCIDNCMHFKDTYDKNLNRRYVCDIDKHVIDPDDLCCKNYKKNKQKNPFGG